MNQQFILGLVADNVSNVGLLLQKVFFLDFVLLNAFLDESYQKIFRIPIQIN